MTTSPSYAAGKITGHRSGTTKNDKCRQAMSNVGSPLPSSDPLIRPVRADCPGAEGLGVQVPRTTGSSGPSFRS